MSPDGLTNKLTTPRRTTPMAALAGLFRTPTRLRTPTPVSRRSKRSRARTLSLSTSSPSTPNNSSLPAIVLQTYSVSTDSIVLTSLPSAPFCCHEDLLTMSRTQLEGVVRALNARLPRRMRICPEDDFWNDDQDHGGVRDDEGDDGVSRMSEAEMKRRIEELVGIRAVVGKNRISRSGLGLSARTGVPPAPKAVRTRDTAWRPCEKTPWEMEVDAEGQSDDSNIMVDDSFMGSSPLAGRTMHSRGRNSTLPRLAILQEESESGESKNGDSDSDEVHPSKRRRVSLRNVTPDHEQESEIREVRGSRLIENMDLSGSPLLAQDDELSTDNFIERDEVVTTPINPDHDTNALEEQVEPPLLRRRSARIKAIALKRTASVDAGKRIASNARNLKSPFSRSVTFSSRRSPGNRNPCAPREMTIRLPFTSTPPHQKPDLSAWSAPRILRSHSQRVPNASQSVKVKSSLGRTQSERYPRASDLAFVTIDRPRYRFARRKSNGTKVAKENQTSQPSMSASPEQGVHDPQSGFQINMEHPNRKRGDEKENQGPGVVAKNFALHTLPSALCGILAPRSRAPSTSTVSSTRGNCGGSSPRSLVKEGTAPAAIEDTAGNDGATERVWEALERMAVDSA